MVTRPGTNLLFPFAVGGATALFSERSTPEKLFEVIERYRPTILTTVPTMINSMLNIEDAGTRDLSSIRFCYSAGEALPVELYHRWKATCGVEICDGIGSAEMFHIYITNRPGDVKPGSLAASSKVTKRELSTPKTARSPLAKWEPCGSKAIQPRSAIGTLMRNQKKLLRAIGARPEISFTSTRKVTIGITAALTTC